MIGLEPFIYIYTVGVGGGCIYVHFHKATEADHIERLLVFGLAVITGGNVFMKGVRPSCCAIGRALKIASIAPPTKH